MAEHHCPTAFRNVNFCKSTRTQRRSQQVLPHSQVVHAHCNTTCTYAHMQLRSPGAGHHAYKHAHIKQKERKKPGHSTKQLTEVMTSRGPKKGADNIALCPAPFHRHGAQDRKSRARPSGPQRLPHNKCAGKQVHHHHHLWLRHPLRPQEKACETPPSSAPVRRTTTGLCTESSHPESSMHSLAHVYRLLPQLVSKASTPSAAHLHNRPAGQRAVP